MKIKEFFEKIQNLPLQQKKVILWAIVVIMGLGFLYLWLLMTKERLENISGNKEEFIKRFEAPSFEAEIFKVPELENEEDFKKIENPINELKNNPEKLEKIKKDFEENPNKLKELMEDPQKLEEFIKEIEGEIKTNN